MSDFKNIDQEVLKLDGVYTKKVSKKIFAAMIVVGACVLYASTRMTEIEIVGVMLFCLSFGMIILGLVGFSKPAEMIYCKQTKEMLVKQVIYFNAADKNVVKNAIMEGNKEVLKLLHNSQNNNMRAIVYATPSYKYSVSQIQTFVPHEYVPVEEPVICNICQAN